MVVQHNISAMTANRYYGINNSSLGKSLEKLSSGYAINRAGDNAAGLAVSEKMRAQISGLTQASKNAQDGISMVQTFEGALQETDSILQRMRTLAVQSANGSYQDDVDRDAMQLEFDQLNDELNQIADTDFNGVVVLNGGTMADGVKAHNGKIDYATKKADITEGARNELVKNIANAEDSLKAARKAYKETNFDLSASGDAAEWNTVDDSQLKKTNEDNLWVNLGYSKPGIASGKVCADTDAADAINITFKYDGATKTWKADSGWSEKSGETKDSFNSTQLQNAVTVATQSVNGASGYGGFKVTSQAATNFDTANYGTQSTDAGALGNAVLDASNVKDGDTVTLRWTNSDPTKVAPTNVGWAQGSVNVTQSNTRTGTTVDLTTPTITMGSLKDTDITEKISKAYNSLNGTNIEINYDTTGTDISLKIGDTSVTSADLAAGKEITFGGVKLFVKNASNNLTISTSDEATTPAADKDLLKISTQTNASNTMGGTVKGQIRLDFANFTNSSGVSVKAGDDPNLESSGKAYEAMTKAAKAIDDANKALADFDALDSNKSSDWEKIKNIYSQEMSSSGTAVSFSDSFDQSKAKLTFADNMSLQVGARTKDVVDFKFSYNTDDLGGLEKNMNCSAREGGLNTASLSIKTQQDANNAIDKIDKALNKVSMVRATFGGIQNRLEHKISNLDTNTENLTAAESRIRDTQMDQEMMKFTSAQILSQASQSMLAQANSLPQGVLQLLG